MRKILATSILVLALTGCASTKLQWSHPDPSDERGKADRYACIMEARTQWRASGGLMWVAAAQMNAEAQANQLFIMCMQARGWSAERVAAADWRPALKSSPTPYLAAPPPPPPGVPPAPPPGAVTVSPPPTGAPVRPTSGAVIAARLGHRSKRSPRRARTISAPPPSSPKPRR